MASARYWLMKTEPDTFSIDDLERVGREPWDGVRNYRARNFMRDEMRPGDGVLFYHSNAKPPGVAGVARVASEPYPDASAFDPESDYFDPKSSPEEPRWILIDVEFVEKTPELVSLEALKTDDSLDGMLVRARGQRLSIQPVDRKHFTRVLKLAKAKSKASDFTRE